VTRKNVPAVKNRVLASDTVACKPLSPEPLDTYMRVILTFFVLMLSCAIIAGCGTIVNSSTQDLGISSNPSGAIVTVNDTNQGTTPVTTELSRKDTHTIKLDLDGYQPYEMIINRSVSGWVWGNILFGGLIGLAIDAGTGGMYKLSPDEISAQMSESASADAQVSEDGVYVIVVLEPCETWDYIGSLDQAEMH